MQPQQQAPWPEDDLQPQPAPPQQPPLQQEEEEQQQQDQQPQPEGMQATVPLSPLLEQTSPMQVQMDQTSPHQPEQQQKQQLVRPGQAQRALVQQVAGSDGRPTPLIRTAAVGCTEGGLEGAFDDLCDVPQPWTQTQLQGLEVRGCVRGVCCVRGTGAGGGGVSE
jgi:hypothetical protein